MQALELPDKRHAPSKTLSGGMKRKLSCAIAIIGGSKGQRSSTRYACSGLIMGCHSCHLGRANQWHGPCWYDRSCLRLEQPLPLLTHTLAARRATWDLLTRFKEGRTMLLSTHFLGNGLPAF